MKIVESYSQGKKDKQDENEDGLYISEQFVALIDGVTAKGTKTWHGKTSGRFAMETIIRHLQTIDIANYQAYSFFESINSLFSKYDGREQIEDIPRASLIVYSDIHKEIWSYGDCQYMVDGQLFQMTKKIDRLNSQLRAFYIEEEILNGKKVEDLLREDSSRGKLMVQLKKQLQFENKENPFGYPVINGGGINPKFVVVTSVEKACELVLASDGYPRLENTLEKSEANLAEILNQDPLCYQVYQSTKGLQETMISFDDRTYCRIKI